MDSAKKIEGGLFHLRNSAVLGLTMKMKHYIQKLFINFQYFSPYLSADMSKMAVAFNTTVLDLEDELMQLILDGQINARIDSHSKVSYITKVQK